MMIIITITVVTSRTDTNNNDYVDYFFSLLLKYSNAQNLFIV